mmetsp:Transcript_17442/g.24399  ORF Transcript_17442/g.24399 Transcript_17442/m.24399 type:complete len:104 (-) Transcript_17442:14-325(-)
MLGFPPAAGPTASVSDEVAYKWLDDAKKLKTQAPLRRAERCLSMHLSPTERTLADKEKHVQPSTTERTHAGNACVYNARVNIIKGNWNPLSRFRCWKGLGIRL